MEIYDVIFLWVFISLRSETSGQAASEKREWEIIKKGQWMAFFLNAWFCNGQRVSLAYEHNFPNNQFFNASTQQHCLFGTLEIIKVHRGWKNYQASSFPFASRRSMFLFCFARLVFQIVCFDCFMLLKLYVSCRWRRSIFMLRTPPKRRISVHSTLFYAEIFPAVSHQDVF